MPKWKRLLLEAQTAAKAAAAISAKATAESRDLTDDERTEYQAKFDLATSKKSESEQAKKDAATEAELKSLAGDMGGDAPTDDDAGSGLQVSDRDDSTLRKSFGEAFVKSEAYQAFRKENPSGVGQGSPVSIGRVKVGSMDDWHSRRKAPIALPNARVAPVRYPTLDMIDRDRLTLLDLVSRGQTEGNFEYVQITAVTRNATVVGESVTNNGTTAAAGLKPISDITTQLADAKVYTYADGYEVTNQLLADAPAFATYMNAELAYSLDSVVEDKLLNGSGVSGEPRGILNTTGVQVQEFDAATAGTYDPEVDADVMALVKAIRRGITRVTRLQGGSVTAVVMSPEDDEAIDLLQDDNGRFYGQGPFGSGPGTIWGRPRVTSERLDPGEPLLGDFKQIALLDREGLSVTAFNQHKDYAQRNLTYVRAELRAAQVIWKPSRLVRVTPAPA